MSGPADFPALATPRLRLRELQPADAPALLRIHGNAAHMRWFGSEPMRTLAEAEAVIELFAGWRRLPAPGTRWGLERRDDGTLIGTAGLFAWHRGWRKCTLGYELAPEATGQGLMGEALAAVIDWGLQHMQLHRIEAQVHPDNRPSLALLERLDFAREGLLREVAWWGGRPHDLEMWSLLAPGWGSSQGGAGGRPVQGISTDPAPR